MFNLRSKRPVAELDMREMLAMIRHRGPDEFGIYIDGPVGLGNARLSIIDLSGGQQPIPNEDGTLWIVFNGEIFNYIELRPELEARGHKFTTTSDTEVLLHAYEEYGPECLNKLNGQFAFAVWNAVDQSLFLARDRLGVRPVFYTFADGDLIFGSEIKALFADNRVSREMDPAVLDQVFTFWSPLAPKTAFKNIFELPPGHYLTARAGQTKIEQFWQLNFPAAPNPPQKSVDEYLEELTSLLVDAAKIRLRADVPVGAYLSGGLDSSIIASIIRNFTSNRLDTFSIAFNDAQFDESVFQRQMAKFLGTEHQVVQATHADIARVFPEVIYHTEVPLTRTSPAPMFLLSKLVRDAGFKVVLTGEGADEFLAGYDIFKEAKIRRFWAQQPNSKFRQTLFQRIYPDIADLSKNNASFLAAFFGDNITQVDKPEYSHAVRWRNNRRSCRFFSNEVKQAATQSLDELLREQLHPKFKDWEPLARAQYLEVKIFLSQYLLSSQGDRMAMANAVEGRYPFLDFRMVEFCNRLPAKLKMRGLTEKYLLKKLGRKWLPPEIWKRPKRPYRAPIHRSFFDKAAPEYVREMLAPDQIKKTGFFNPTAVAQLVQKATQGGAIGETDDMALVGIISTQLLHHHFVSSFKKSEPLSARDRVKVRMGKELSLA
jgi:asparagine synthase (glutamine-hydrolysing)